jgi:hypothetical protein
MLHTRMDLRDELIGLARDNRASAAEYGYSLNNASGGEELLRSGGVLSGHRIQSFESESLSGPVRRVGEERFIGRCQCQLRPVLRQQHLASTPANNAVFR